MRRATPGAPLFRTANGPAVNNWQAAAATAKRDSTGETPGENALFESRVWASQKAERPFPATVGSQESNQGPERGCLGYRLRTVLGPTHVSLGTTTLPEPGTWAMVTGTSLPLAAAAASFILRRDWLERTALACAVLTKVKMMLQGRKPFSTLNPFRKDTGLNKFKKRTKKK